MTRAHSGGSDGRTAESLAVRVAARLPELTDALVRTIQNQNPGYRAVDVVPHDDLWRSCHDNLARVLQMIGDGPAGSAQRYDGTQHYDAARATGQRRAEQRMPLDDVLRSFRLGGRLVWEALIDQAHADRSVDTEGLLDLATRVWEVVDTTSAQVAAAYHATGSDLLRADEQRRAAVWEGLLHGRGQDLAFAYEASRVIGLPVDGRYVVVAADVSSGTAPAAMGTDSAWQVRANTLVGILAVAQTAPGALPDTVTGPAGVSLVVHGLAEIDVAYRQATLARRTLPRGSREVALLAERLPEALLLSAPELSGQLVRRWLGDLLAMPAAERRLLLGTLQIWVATGGSIRHTAEAACCHRNTVINRLQRMQAITGHDFTDPACQVELALALRASALLTGQD
jgi:hypothetical protein